MAKHQGGCHCGKVRYEVDMTIDGVMSCNCSICSKKGHLLAFAPESVFKLEKGDDSLSSYRFNKKAIDHLFCKTCGIASFGRGAMPDGTRMIAINVRCLDGVDAESYPVQKIDGKSF